MSLESFFHFKSIEHSANSKNSGVEVLSRLKAEHSSIIIFRLENQTPINIIKHMEVILTNYSSQLLEGVVLLITEKKYRIRRLPIQ